MDLIFQPGFNIKASDIFKHTPKRGASSIGAFMMDITRRDENSGSFLDKNQTIILDCLEKSFKHDRGAQTDRGINLKVSKRDNTFLNIAFSFTAFLFIGN